MGVWMLEKTALSIGFGKPGLVLELEPSSGKYREKGYLLGLCYIKAGARLLEIVLGARDRLKI